MWENVIYLPFSQWLRRLTGWTRARTSLRLRILINRPAHHQVRGAYRNLYVLGHTLLQRHQLLCTFRQTHRTAIEEFFFDTTANKLNIEIRDWGFFFAHPICWGRYCSLLLAAQHLRNTKSSTSPVAGRATIGQGGGSLTRRPHIVVRFFISLPHLNRFLLVVNIASIDSLRTWALTSLIWNNMYKHRSLLLYVIEVHA